MSNETLKPCPFCGSENIEIAPIGEYVFCNDCYTIGPQEHGNTSEEKIQRAIAAWNKRVKETVI
jgi:Lar family restriction alleviation protein